MHDGSVATGDAWMKSHLDAYAKWAKTHNSLLVVTFDEDDDAHGNRIFTTFVGQSVKVGQYGEHIDHYSLLRTLEDLYGLSCTGKACGAKAIADVWK
jgi:acid phosphatase